MAYKTLWFVRHGETEWNAAQRMQGRWNSDLSDLGREQADAHGQLLADKDIEAIVSSPLTRTRQTVEMILGHVSAPVSFDDRIVEWDCGDWSGHLYAEVMERWSEEYAALRADPFHYRGPGCENYPDMFERARPFVDDLLTRPERRIAVVSHGMIGKVMLSILLGLEPAETLSVFQPNDVVFRVRHGPDGHAVHHWQGTVGPMEGLTKWET